MGEGGEKQDVRKIGRQEVVGSGQRARRGSPASRPCLQWWAAARKVRWLWGQPGGIVRLFSLWPGRLWPRVDQTSCGGNSPSFASLLDSPVVLSADRKSLSLSPFLRALLLAEMGHVTTLNHNNRPGWGRWHVFLRTSISGVEEPVGNDYINFRVKRQLTLEGLTLWCESLWNYSNQR